MGFKSFFAKRRGLQFWLALIALTALLMLASWAMLQGAAPRLAVLALLAAMGPITLLWRMCLLPVHQQQEQLHEAPMSAPFAQLLQERLLLLEAELEHAPVALFQFAQDGSVAAPVLLPRNAKARRLLAPGRISDVHYFAQQLQQLPLGRRSVLQFDTEGGAERALVASQELILHGQTQRLIACMPVEGELEGETLRAWQQLVHVLTHEIMNSLTPVASLSRTAQDLLQELREQLPARQGRADDLIEVDANQVDANELVQDLSTALDAINRRAASLEKFVSSYRSLANPPVAKAETIELASIFERLAALVGPEWQARNGSASFTLHNPGLQVVLDAGQFEQAMLNLLKNALQASSQVAAPRVQVSARLVRGGRLRIEVSDNGPGVPQELIAHIFTPFFTTKLDGSGIGLAMVRQLVHANGGSVRYVKSLGAGATFVLLF